MRSSLAQPAVLDLMLLHFISPDAALHILLAPKLRASTCLQSRRIELTLIMAQHGRRPWADAWPAYSCNQILRGSSWTTCRHVVEPVSQVPAHPEGG